MGRGVEDPRERGDEMLGAKREGPMQRRGQVGGDEDQRRSLRGWNFTLKATDLPHKAISR